MPYRNTYRGFLRFCRDCGYALAPFQKRIARAFFEDAREVGVCLPRGNAKSTLAALIALHHVLAVEAASVYVGAASLEQARVVGDIVQRYGRRKALAGLLTVRHDEVRLGDRRGAIVLRIVSSDGARAFGWERPTLLVADEVWAYGDRPPTLLSAMVTSLVKSPTAKLLLISTAPMLLDSPLGRIRERALSAPDVHREGSRIEARGNGLTWLEWSLPDDAEATPANVARANPAPWVTLSMLAEQRQRVTDMEWLVFHGNRSHVQSARWLPVGAWQACAADYTVADDEPLVLGVDVGGSRSSTALVGVVADGDGVRVALVEVRTGKPAVLALVASIRELHAQGRPISMIVGDPMRFEADMLRLEADLGVTVVSWPQSESRMTRCSENLARLVIEQRIRHADHPTLNAHVANAIAKPTPRGWRLVRGGGESQHIDGVIALAMAAEMAEKQPPVARVLGWA